MGGVDGRGVVLVVVVRVVVGLRGGGDGVHLTRTLLLALLSLVSPLLRLRHHRLRPHLSPSPCPSLLSHPPTIIRPTSPTCIPPIPPIPLRIQLRRQLMMRGQIRWIVPSPIVPVAPPQPYRTHLRSCRGHSRGCRGGGRSEGGAALSRCVGCCVVVRLLLVVGVVAAVGVVVVEGGAAADGGLAGPPAL